MRPSRVHPGEWLIGLIGLAVVAGLLLPWSGDESALSSPGLLDLILLLIALAAILLPIVVAASRRTNVPIAYETMLWLVSLLLLVVLVVRAIFPPDAGFDSGFWLVFAGTFAMGFALWRTVARGH